MAFSEKHTSENLKSSLLEITENWGIRKKIVACTSDNAANISLASCDILERFKEITTDLSSEKSVPISKVILYSQALITYSTQLPTKDLTPQYESNPLLSEATFLDHRFKKYGFQNEQSFKKVKEIIVNKGKLIVTKLRSAIDQNVSVPAVLNNIGKENSIWQEFDAGVENVVQSLNPTATIIVEVDKYPQEPPIPRTQDPLKWWNNNRQIYPTLFIMMKKRLCIQATSVPSERVFSKSGQIVSTKRSRLLSKKVEQIVFLNYNLK
ncbi:unnamed protein product [Macrosiphum euphorbiae]|nr:unnamed protein product [Macrosiphum euphorbiae]